MPALAEDTGAVSDFQHSLVFTKKVLKKPSGLRRFTAM